MKSLGNTWGGKSLDEILDCRRMNWIEKVAKIPETFKDNQLQRKLLGALEVRDGKVAN